MLDVKILEELFYVLVDNLSLVFDNGVWDSKLANFAFPYKSLHLLSRDNCKGFCFHPFSEVINNYQQEFYLPLS